jgi:multidrug resistance efflux pump
MKGLGRVLMINLVVLLVLAGAAAIGYYYWYQGYTYVATDNAQVAATEAVITAPASGRLTNWHGALNTHLGAGAVVADIATGPHSAVAVTTPIAGTVVESLAVPGELVAAGTPLGTVADMGHVYILANVAETAIHNVKVGQTVDVTVDSVPDQTFTGHVSTIYPATAGAFSLLPQENTTTNYTKVTQVVPVKITLDSTLGYDLRLGESAEVRIHVH